MGYGDLLAENCEFFLPHSHLTPSFGVNPFVFLDELFIAKSKTRFLGLSVGEDFAILACVILTQCQRVTDGETDVQPDRITNTGLCIASYLTPCKNGKVRRKLQTHYWQSCLLWSTNKKSLTV